MTIKKFGSFGVAGGKFNSAWDYSMSTYATRSEKLVPTPIIFKDNIFSEDIKSAKYVLDVGCGIGRVLSSVMQDTNAKYIGIDPNPSAKEFFWSVQDKEKYGDRVELHSDFSTINPDIKFDLVLSIFTMQHISFMPDENTMNCVDIYREIFKFTTDSTVFMMYEHDNEMPWQTRFMQELDILPQIFMRDYKGFPDHLDRGDHNLILWRRQR